MQIPRFGMMQDGLLPQLVNSAGDAPRRPRTLLEAALITPLPHHGTASVMKRRGETGTVTWRRHRRRQEEGVGFPNCIEVSE